MSMHHASLNAERLALGWHILALVVSFSIASMAALCTWLLAVAENAVMLPGMIAWLQSFLMVEVFLASCGIFFHIWAVYQHIDHLRLLRQPKDYAEICH